MMKWHLGNGRPVCTDRLTKGYGRATAKAEAFGKVPAEARCKKCQAVFAQLQKRTQQVTQ